MSKAQTVFEALKLAQATLEAIATHCDLACVVTPDGAFYLQPAIAALREALAEQPAQQEPVAWMDGYRNIYSLEEKAAGCPEATIALVPMANHEKTSGSPIKELNCICGAVWEGDELVHLPRPPAQRKPLTDEEISEIAINTPPMVHEFARAIECAHGIKENT